MSVCMVNAQEYLRATTYQLSSSSHCVIGNRIVCQEHKISAGKCTVLCVLPLQLTVLSHVIIPRDLFAFFFCRFSSKYGILNCKIH